MDPIYGENMEGTLYWFNEWGWLSDEGDQHFGGIWWIDWGNDGTTDVSGTHRGVATPSLECNIRGQITDGAPDLIDHKIHTLFQIEFIDGVPTIVSVLQIN